MARVFAPCWWLPWCRHWFPPDRHVSLATRLRYFDTIITPVPCFAAGHRMILKISTRLTWHSVNCFGARSAHQLPLTGHGLGMKSCMTGMHGLHNLLNNIRWKKHWSLRYLEMHWKLAHYAANLPPDRWLARILTWTCKGHQVTGRQRNTWDTMIQKFCRYQQLGIGLDVARDASRCSYVFFTFTCALHGLPTGIQVWLHFTSLVDNMMEAEVTRFVATYTPCMGQPSGYQHRQTEISIPTCWWCQKAAPSSSVLTVLHSWAVVLPATFRKYDITANDAHHDQKRSSHM